MRMGVFPSVFSAKIVSIIFLPGYTLPITSGFSESPDATSQFSIQLFRAFDELYLAVNGQVYTLLVKVIGNIDTERYQLHFL